MILKVSDMLKRLNCGILALIMFIPCVIMLFDQTLCFVGGLVLTLTIFASPLLIPVLLIINIFAFIEVLSNERDWGSKLTQFGGFIGGFIAANIFNRNFPLRREVNKVFVVSLYIFVIYPVFTYLCMPNY